MGTSLRSGAFLGRLDVVLFSMKLGEGRPGFLTVTGFAFFKSQEETFLVNSIRVIHFCFPKNDSFTLDNFIESKSFQYRNHAFTTDEARIQ